MLLLKSGGRHAEAIFTFDYLTVGASCKDYMIGTTGVKTLKTQLNIRIFGLSGCSLYTSDILLSK